MSADCAVVGVKSSRERAVVMLLADAHVGDSASARRLASRLPRTPDLDWLEAENVSHLAAAENVAQAGAGALLLGVGIIEMLLGVWAAGWWQGGIVVSVALFGAAALARAVAAVARRPASSDRVQPVDADLSRSVDGRRTTGRKHAHQALIRNSVVRGG